MNRTLKLIMLPLGVILLCTSLWYVQVLGIVALATCIPQSK